jgi:broad specificity phosphatase PhoE
MRGRIIIARHGRPNLSREVKITSKEYGEWWKQYDASGLHPDERVPASLVEAAKGAAHVYSSTLPRAIETAKQVVQGARDVPQDALFVEAHLPPPPIPGIKLRPGTWGGISRAFWICGYTKGGKFESHFATWKRVHQIADRLIEMTEDGNVVLCAHGYLNWMIYRCLKKRHNWLLVHHEGRNDYWSWRAYEHGARETAIEQRPATAE